MKIIIELEEGEGQGPLERAFSEAVHDAVAELDRNIAEMKGDMEKLSEEMMVLRKSFKTAIDPWAYKNFFDEVSTASRLLVEKMRKYLDEMVEREMKP